MSRRVGPSTVPQRMVPLSESISRTPSPGFTSDQSGNETPDSGPASISLVEPEQRRIPVLPPTTDVSVLYKVIYPFSDGFCLLTLSRGLSQFTERVIEVHGRKLTTPYQSIGPQPQQAVHL